MIRGHGPGQLDDATLGCAIGRNLRPADQGELGTHIDDGPAALLAHHRDDGAAAEEDALEVDVEEAVPIRFARLIDSAEDHGGSIIH